MVTAATLTINNTGGIGTGGTGTTLNCSVNGTTTTTLKGCTGTVNINGQTCTFTYTNGTVVVTCIPGAVPASTTNMPATTTGTLATTTNMPATVTGTPVTLTSPNCNVNGTMLMGCTGTVNINGQTAFAFANGMVSVMGTPVGVTSPISNTFPFNNIGISDDVSMGAGNFDGGHYSYSAQTLQSAQIAPGKMIIANGVAFTWSTTKTGSPDNVQAQGQTILVTPINNATTLAFLGAATNGGVQGTQGMATITYTDGTIQPFVLAFSDWTLNAAKATQLVNGNQIVERFNYRNSANGPQLDKPYIFYTSVALQAGKTILSVTLPAIVNHGQLHVFAISTK